MNKLISKIAVGALAGLGLGWVVGKRAIRKLETERNDLLEKNGYLRTECVSNKAYIKDLEMVNTMLNDRIKKNES